MEEDESLAPTRTPHPYKAIKMALICSTYDECDSIYFFYCFFAGAATAPGGSSALNV
jgi:hypothetical protein